jgi:hypothetical protein
LRFFENGIQWDIFQAIKSALSMPLPPVSVFPTFSLYLVSGPTPLVAVPNGPPPNCLASSNPNKPRMMGTLWCVATNPRDVKCDDVQANNCRGICATTNDKVEKGPRCLFMDGVRRVDVGTRKECRKMCMRYLCNKRDGIGYVWCGDPVEGVEAWLEGAVLEEGTVKVERKWPWGPGPGWESEVVVAISQW